MIEISSDTAESQRKFVGRRRSPYRLVSDADGSLRRLYGVPRTLGLIPGRVTYVIDRSGMVRRVFSSQFRPRKHAEEAVEAVQALRNPG